MRGPAVVVALGLAAPALFASASAGAQADDAERPSLTVIVDGDAPAPIRAALARPRGDLPVALRFAALPTAEGGVVPGPRHEARIAEAREAYVNADFDGCLARLREDGPIHEELAAGRRRAAARWLFWRTACRVGAGDPGAGEDAARFAALGLELPADVSTASPEVERALGDALAAETPRWPVRVTASTTARVSIDGRAPTCQTPCTVDLPAGDHVIAWSADGFVPAWRLVRATEGATAEVALAPASPELAARQWAARYVGRGGWDSTASVELLARAVRARRLAVLLADAEGAGTHVAAVLALDGEVAARAERRIEGEVASGAWALLRDLLVAGGAVEPAPSVVESPWFWIGVGLGVAAAATVTALLLYDPGTRTTVGF